MVNGSVPSAWVVRGGRRGEREQYYLERGLCGGGWDAVRT